MQRLSQRFPQVKPSAQRHRITCQQPERRVGALQICEERGACECQCQRHQPVDTTALIALRVLDEGGEPASRLVRVAADPPEAPQRGGQSRASPSVPHLDKEPQRRAQVVVLALHPVEPDELRSPVVLRVRPLRQREEVVGVPGALRLALTRALEQVRGVLARCLEHREPRFLHGSWRTVQQAFGGE
jgi:hypothetical protein